MSKDIDLDEFCKCGTLRPHCEKCYILKPYYKCRTLELGRVTRVMTRRRLLPKWCSWFNIYLHTYNTVDDDDLEKIHDHPWASISINWRGYIVEEWMHIVRLVYWKRGSDKATKIRGCLMLRKAPLITFRSSRTIHRIRHTSEGARTIMIVFGRRQNWGFWSPSHRDSSCEIHNYEYTDYLDYKNENG